MGKQQHKIKKEKRNSSTRATVSTFNSYSKASLQMTFVGRGARNKERV